MALEFEGNCTLTVESLTIGASPPTLAAVPDAVMEWWFVQGRIEGANGPDLYFMCAFFQVRKENADSEPAQMLLVHLMRADGTPVSAISRASTDLVDVYRTIASRVIDSRYPKVLRDFLLRRHMSVSAGFAKAEGIEFTQSRANVSTDRCSIEWDGFLFCEEGDGFRLVLPETGIPSETEGGLHVKLVPEKPWLCENGTRFNPDFMPSYHYYSCPRLKVVGKSGGREVQGKAWIDRQWGLTLNNWFLSERAGAIYPLGWDWLGLSLDNDLDFLVMRFGFAGEQDSAENCIVRLDGGSASKIEGQFVALPDPHWVSQKSGTAYPLRHRLYMPQHQTDILIEPVSLDQEMPVFGASPVWEGAVRAKGMSEGRQVEGYGRLELFGYGYTDDLVRSVVRKLRVNLQR